MIRLLIAAMLALAAPALAQERIEIPSHEAEAPKTLVAHLSKPKGTGPFPAIVMLHGCGGAYDRKSGKLNSRHRQWEKVFREAGYVVLQLDSFTTRGLEDGICTRRDRPITVSQERRRDVAAALDYLKTVPEVRIDRVGIVGWSNGGSTVLAAMQPVDDERLPIRVAVAFYPGCRAAGGGTFSPAGPMLILMGANDNWTHPRPCVLMVDGARHRGQTIDFHLYPGAYHDFDWPGMKINTVKTSRGTATAGLDPEAQADALKRVPAYLATWLKD